MPLRNVIEFIGSRCASKCDSLPFLASIPWFLAIGVIDVIVMASSKHPKSFDDTYFALVVLRTTCSVLIALMLFWQGSKSHWTAPSYKRMSKVWSLLHCELRIASILRHSAKRFVWILLVLWLYRMSWLSGCHVQPLKSCRLWNWGSLSICRRRSH